MASTSGTCPDGRHLAPTIRDQIQLFSAPPTVPEAAFEACGSHVPAGPPPAVSAPGEEPAGPLSERIKASVTVLEFVGRCVDLKPMKSGAVGRGPFHADHRPSFGVNDEGNYWHCFAGCDCIPANRALEPKRSFGADGLGITRAAATA